MHQKKRKHNRFLLSKYAENDKSANTILLKAAKAPALITNRTLTGATNLVPFGEIIRLALNRPINEPNASPNIINPAKNSLRTIPQAVFSFTRHAGTEGEGEKKAHMV
ncbi:hypothetical protein P5486_002940 [Bacillus velezensis]|uniref:hypothetical protein n=1 Tax=Bacillus velezensis TaxID=492670 RepID=UPI002453573D|nr:hypothetical protein [Bacillus amyloliquefaciens]MDH3073474.1 hypothetical protein [Bacillus velezensis]MDH3080003.1 hypothetical protein [Bacillus amyloliquefaciens]MDH3084428.1 hypothetical protein [Bacillus velezensis]MDH3105076.1 hypothetical protein [Bacillus velezensis]